MNFLGNLTSTVKNALLRNNESQDNMQSQGDEIVEELDQQNNQLEEDMQENQENQEILHANMEENIKILAKALLTKKLVKDNMIDYLNWHIQNETPCFKIGFRNNPLGSDKPQTLGFLKMNGQLGEDVYNEDNFRPLNPDEFQNVNAKEVSQGFLQGLHEYGSAAFPTQLIALALNIDINIDSK